jgi:hypothetical protein
VYDDLTGPVDVDTALGRLFDIEEAWWQERATAAGLPTTLGMPVLRSVVVAGVLLAADGLDDAVGVLRRLPGLTGVGVDLLRNLALWLRGLYPNKAGGWLNPHLPGRLTERYTATQLATNPALTAAIAAAVLPPGSTP